jgi:hypothetical protein
MNLTLLCVVVCCVLISMLLVVALMSKHSAIIKHVYFLLVLAHVLLFSLVSF